MMGVFNAYESEILERRMDNERTHIYRLPIDNISIEVKSNVGGCGYVAELKGDDRSLDEIIYRGCTLNLSRVISACEGFLNGRLTDEQKDRLKDCTSVAGWMAIYDVNATQGNKSLDGGLEE